jgi:hypothetical protein
MKEERSLHANVSGVGRHVLTNLFLCIRFTYYLIFHRIFFDHPWRVFLLKDPLF